MKIKKTLFRFSCFDALLYAWFMIFVINVLILFYLLLRGTPEQFTDPSTWSIRFVLPLVNAVISVAINRDGMMEFTDVEDTEKLLKQIEAVILKRYMTAKSTPGIYRYIKKTKWGRFFDFVINEEIDVIVSKKKISVFARRNMLNYIGGRFTQ